MLLLLKGYDRTVRSEIPKTGPKDPRASAKIVGQKNYVFKSDPFDTRLHTKPLSTPLEGIYSFRVTREYRVLFRFVAADAVLLIAVKHRKDIYR